MPNLELVFARPKLETENTHNVGNDYTIIIQTLTQNVMPKAPHVVHSGANNGPVDFD